MSLTFAPEHPFHGMARQMGKLVDQLHKGYSNFAPDETWTPNVNLYETVSSYLVCIDLAGVDKEKIEVTVDHHVLKLRGQRAVPGPDGIAGDHPGRIRVHLMEIDHGSFFREVELPPDVTKDHISAQYINGLLWVELPKAK